MNIQIVVEFLNTQVNSVNRKEEAPKLLMSYKEGLLKLDQGAIVRSPP